MKKKSIKKRVSAPGIGVFHLFLFIACGSLPVRGESDLAEHHRKVVEAHQKADHQSQPDEEAKKQKEDYLEFLRPKAKDPLAAEGLVWLMLVDDHTQHGPGSESSKEAEALFFKHHLPRLPVFLRALGKKDDWTKPHMGAARENTKRLANKLAKLVEGESEKLMCQFIVGAISWGVEALDAPKVVFESSGPVTFLAPGPSEEQLEVLKGIAAHDGYGSFAETYPAAAKRLQDILKNPRKGNVLQVVTPVKGKSVEKVVLSEKLGFAECYKKVVEDHRKIDFSTRSGLFGGKALKEGYLDYLRPKVKDPQTVRGLIWLMFADNHNGWGPGTESSKEAEALFFKHHLPKLPVLLREMAERSSVSWEKRNHFDNLKNYARIADQAVQLAESEADQLMGKFVNYSLMRGRPTAANSLERGVPNDQLELLQQLSAEKGFDSFVEAYPDAAKKRASLVQQTLKRKKADEQNAIAIGQKAPKTIGKDAEGKELKLSDYLGKVVLLAFWGDW